MKNVYISVGGQYFNVADLTIVLIDPHRNLAFCASRLMRIENGMMNLDKAINDI